VIEGLVVNVMDGVEVHCGDSDFTPIPIPSGSTCGAYMKEFFQYGAGYIKDENATDMCEYCPYQYGNDFYEQRIGWSFDNRWRDFGILCAYYIFNVFAFMFFVFLFRKAKR
jgi:ABC-type multidrug transport system permease subunit